MRLRQLTHGKRIVTTLLACAALCAGATSCGVKATNEYEDEAREMVERRKEEATVHKEEYVFDESDTDELVFDESDSDEYEALPPYDEFAANIDQYVGRKFIVSGRITGKETSILLEKGDKSDKNVWAYVYWDESQTHGQVAAIRIPYKRYNGLSGSWLKGKCVCEGTDDRGNPQFEAIEYEVGHGE